jgi:hypothetical protein
LVIAILGACGLVFVSVENLKSFSGPSGANADSSTTDTTTTDTTTTDTTSTDTTTAPSGYPRAATAVGTSHGE